MKKYLGLLLCLLATAAIPQSQQPIPTGNVLGNFTGATARPKANNAVIISTFNALGILYSPTTTTLASGAALTNGALIVGSASGPVSFGGAVNPNSSVTNTAFGSTGCGSAGAGVTGTAESCFGQNSLNIVTSGNSNSCFGEDCGVNITTGGGNSGLGATSLQGSAGAPTTGSNNTANGYESLFNCQGACGSNTAIGAFAAASNTTGLANTVIGEGVGFTGMLTGSNNVLIGTSTNCTLATNSTNNSLTLCTGSTGLITITGGGTPSTSVTTIAGTLKASAYFAAGTTFTLGTGTGACATSSTLVGGAQAGSFLCTGTSGASTQVINLPTSANGWACWASDVGSGVAWSQSATATNSCTISGALAVTSQKVVFGAMGY